MVVRSESEHSGAMLSPSRRPLLVTAATATLGLALALAAAPAEAAGGYGPARLVCSFADPEINESSGIASTSWDDGVVWTHNDSGDSPRFFAVSRDTCATVGVYRVTGATAVDWEDMARSGRTLHFADIGDNRSSRASITVYDVPEPGPGTPSGTVNPSATRVLTYPDGPHNAESLFVDPTTGQLVIVTKTPLGPSAAYRVPPAGNGVMEKVAEVTFAGPTTGGDASADRIAVRTYDSAYEWDVRSGDTLAAVLARPPTTFALPVTPQGEAIAYTRDGSGLWISSETRAGPVHLLTRPAEPVAPEEPVAPGVPGPAAGRDVPLPIIVGLAAAAVTVAVLARRRRRARAG